jgi:hypothetical protein
LIFAWCLFLNICLFWVIKRDLAWSLVTMSLMLCRNGMASNPYVVGSQLFPGA